MWSPLLLALLLVATACRPSQEEALITRAIKPMQDALAMMQAAKGDDQALMIETMQYRARHNAELVTLRQDGEAYVRSLPSDEARRRFGTALDNAARPVLAQIVSESQKFKDSHRALVYVRPLVAPGTPRQIPGHRPWLFQPQEPFDPAEALSKPATPAGRP